MTSEELQQIAETVQHQHEHSTSKSMSAWARAVCRSTATS